MTHLILTILTGVCLLIAWLFSLAAAYHQGRADGVQWCRKLFWGDL